MAAAQAHMARGELVPDHVVLSMIRERRKCLRCQGGFILDGFPRTLSQARALDALLAVEALRLDAVISYDADEGVLLTRLAGRRVCPRCRLAFHVETHPPRIEGVCDACGGALEQRADDRPQVVAVRLQTHGEAVRPLIVYYAARGVLVRVRAEGAPVDILARTLDALAERVAASKRVAGPPPGRGRRRSGVEARTG